MTKEIFSTAEEKMKKTIEVLKKELSSIRTGKATPSLLEGIRVEYYDSMVPLNQVATVSVPDYKLIIIQPWEKKLIPENVDYVKVRGLSRESAEKLAKIKPRSLGQMARIPGVRSADVTVLMIHLESMRAGAKEKTVPKDK